MPEEDVLDRAEQSVEPIREYPPIMALLIKHDARMTDEVAKGNLTTHEAELNKAGFMTFVLALVEYAELEHFNHFGDIPRS